MTIFPRICRLNCKIIELLQINGVVLHKMCHLNASVAIKGIPGVTLEFLLLRKDAALDILAVSPVNRFPEAYDQLEHLHSSYKNVRTLNIQKVNLNIQPNLLTLKFQSILNVLD